MQMLQCYPHSEYIFVVDCLYLSVVMKSQAPRLLNLSSFSNSKIKSNDLLLADTQAANHCALFRV